ncbi:MAG TPA: DNA starvation/stationary phase protection protein [Streptomyces sp.]|nr:DNA starvation/stationary phase protection protein [Streptomyces sp.]
MYAVKSTLPDQELKVVGEALQGALVDLLNLSLVAKQVHWTVIGPRFRTIHLQLDEVVSTARSYSDTVAERAAALGVAPDGRAATVAASAAVAGVESGWNQDDKAVQIMVDALGTVAKRMRERMDATEKPDPVTQDVLIGLIAALEKHYWMFQAEHRVEGK